jgi:hypothetical protein
VSDPFRAQLQSEFATSALIGQPRGHDGRLLNADPGIGCPSEWTGKGSGSYLQNRGQARSNRLELLTETLAYRGVEESLLVRGRALAAKVVSHFRGLIEGQMLIPFPGS